MEQRWDCKNSSFIKHSFGFQQKDLSSIVDSASNPQPFALLTLRTMDINCTEKELFIFNKISHAAEELGMKTYLIGGFVRDKILGRITRMQTLFVLEMGSSLQKQ